MQQSWGKVDEQRAKVTKGCQDEWGEINIANVIGFSEA